MATQTHYRTCNLCEAMCGIEIKVDGDEILSIRGDKNDPFSRGHICPKAVALQDIYHDPDRLRHPVRRTATGWERISWDDAFEEVVSQIQRIQKAYGRNAMGVYVGNPNVHNLGSMLFMAPFLRALRSKNRYSATSVDQLPHHFASYFMFGHQLLIPIPDIDRTDFFLILGANPLASNGSLMTAPGMARRLRELQQRGGKVVVVDPRRSETAAKANQHLFIKPGSDVLLLLGLLHTVYDEKLTNTDYLADFTDGLELLEDIVSDFAPEKVAPMTGIAADTIRQLARDFAAAKTAVCYGRMGASTQAFGGLTQWLINAFNIVTGNFDRPGGAMFTKPAFDIVGITGMMRSTGHFGAWHSRVRGLPEFGGELPVAALAEEILTEGEGQIKGMVTVAGNPVLSTPNGMQLEKAFEGLEFMVSIDIYINETTRHANIILPPTTGLETNHYDLIFHVFGVRNTAKYSPALFEGAEDSKHDWEIMRELRFRLEGRHKAGWKQSRRRAKQDFMGRLSPDKIVDLALRFGPYGAWGKNGVEKEGLKLSTLKKEVHGVDLGPLQPCLPERLFTPQKRIQLTPELLVADLERVNVTFFALPSVNRNNGSNSSNGTYLSLIGRRQLRSNNSWMHNSKRLVKGKERCTLLIHPTDAEKRQIEPGQVVNVQSRVGEIQIRAEVSDQMMPGVVSIPHGWGHHRTGTHLQTAQQHAGVSINDLTDDYALDELSGNAAFSGVPVQVMPL